MRALLLLFFLATAAAAEEAKECVGTVISPPPALLAQIDDQALLAQAEGAPGKGKLCAAKVFEVKKPLTVYRVWDKSKSYSALGGWWSLSYPEGSRESYRKANDICPEWSALDVMSACTLKVGTRVVIGPGQSAQCAEGLYPQSAANQVYVPNDSRAGRVYVNHCADAPWPPAEQ